jgi:hypothetical protein
MSIGQPAAVTDEVAPVTERERVAPSA